MTAVLIAHRHRVDAELLAAVVAQDPDLECVGAMTSLEEAVGLTADTDVDVLVVDLTLCVPDAGDVSAAARAHVVGVAAQLTFESLAAALRAGAVRVVDAESDVEELLEVLRQLP